MIRIGTRNSALALWQAEQVKATLEEQGNPCRLVLIESEGDKNQHQPLYAMGIQGIFTKALDTALLNNSVDIAVHSLKDVPTALPEGIQLAAVLPRGSVSDVLVFHPEFKGWEATATIGTGSLRRKAQWLKKYPNHRVDNLRGNVQTRLNTLSKSDWSGAIFAKAGLERLELMKGSYEVLDWMIPAPAQGAVGICSLTTNASLLSSLKEIHCETTDFCVSVERQFLKTLEGGCTAPIGALAVLNGNTLQFKGGLFHPNGTVSFVIEETLDRNAFANPGLYFAKKIDAQVGKDLMIQIKKEM